MLRPGQGAVPAVQARRARHADGQLFGDGCAAHRLRHAVARRAEAAAADAVEHDPEKWIPVFGKDHAQKISPPRRYLAGARPAAFASAMAIGASWATRASICCGV